MTALPMLGSVALQWIAQRNQPKKGHWSKVAGIPVAYVGSSRRESRATCEATGCPLLDSGECYAWGGTPAMGFSSIARGIENGRGYSLRRALDESARLIGPERLPLQSARIGGLGDPWVLERSEVLRIREELERDGLKWLFVYTHGWENVGAHLRGQSMASCGDLVEADRAVDAGFRAAAILPWDAPRVSTRTPAGRRVTPCPAQLPRFEGSRTCNACGLCDASRDVVPVVGFFDHSRRALAARARALRGSQ